MSLYAESSAVLAWLLDESSADAVRSALAQAEQVLASDLTLVECDRALLRARAEGRIGESSLADRRAFLERAASHWHVLRLNGEIIERARRPFPGEPLRTLDAFHLASALFARGFVPGLRLLSLDRRVRTSGGTLGFELLPAEC